MFYCNIIIDCSIVYDTCKIEKSGCFLLHNLKISEYKRESQSSNIYKSEFLCYV